MLSFMFLITFLWVKSQTCSKQIGPKWTGLDRFFSVSVRSFRFFHNRQPVPVPVRQNLAKKPDQTRPLNTTLQVQNWLKKNGVWPLSFVRSYRWVFPIVFLYYWTNLPLIVRFLSMAPLFFHAMHPTSVTTS